MDAALARLITQGSSSFS